MLRDAPTMRVVEKQALGEFIGRWDRDSRFQEAKEKLLRPPTWSF